MKVTRRLEQVLGSILLMLSLLAGTAAACACSHHQVDPPKADAKSSCHSHPGTTETAAVDTDADRIDESCVCFINQRTPAVVAKAKKETKADNTPAAEPADHADTLHFVAVLTETSTAAAFEQALSYSNTLRSLLPARAPPRL